jgi:SAM-dependent methyltransferase
MLEHLPHNPSILDVGCGAGLQTIEIARLSDGYVTALDSYQIFLDLLNQRVRAADLSRKVRIQQGSMFELPYGPATFDVIWSEGAIYIIGLEKGLQTWRPFLKQGGYLVASHISWLASDVPEEPRRFWEEDYPAITTVTENIDTFERAGYTINGHLELPESAWWDDYYLPIEQRLIDLRNKYQDSAAVKASVENMQREIDLYRRYSAYYGYVFYIARRKD